MIKNLIVMATCVWLAGVKSEKLKEPIEVYTMKTKRQEIADTIHFGGFIEAKDSRGVGPEIDGTITQVSVELGQMVKKGQLLYQVRPKGAGADFRNHSVVAPIAGVIANLKHEAGELVAAGQAVVTVADSSKLIVKIQVTYDDLDVVKLGDEVTISTASSAQRSEEILGSVSAISPVADLILGTFAIKAALDCQKDGCPPIFKLGTFVRVLTKKNVRKGIMLPIKALVSEREKVFILKSDSTVALQTVTLGTYYGDQVEVTKGLKPGSIVVTNYSKYPQDGDLVLVKSVEEEKAKGLTKTKVAKKEKG